MNVILVLLPISLLLGGFFVVSFIWATRKGQYDDLETPDKRILFEDKPKNVEKRIEQ
jgi:cbb3-type cytochrome oxidase maturation protein